MRGCWIDRDYDLNHASDGISRYGLYVRLHPEPFWETVAGMPNSVMRVVTQAAGPFAAAAWTVATPPIMAPGLIRWHRAIRQMETAYDYVEDALTVRAAMLKPPVRLTNLEVGPRVHLEEVPEKADTPEHVVLSWLVPAQSLHVPDWVPGDEYPAMEDVWESVETLVWHVNLTLQHVLEHLLPHRLR